MIYVDEGDFPSVLRSIERAMASAPVVGQERWQGIDVSRDPAAVVHELRNVCFEVDLGGDESLDRWRRQIEPNLPWADDHFAERVGGEPLNPAVQWRNWPWGRNAAKFRNEDEIFNHSYTERLWPRYARTTRRGEVRGDSLERTEGIRAVPRNIRPRTGIAHEYGDLQSLVEYLASLDRFTRLDPMLVLPGHGPRFRDVPVLVETTRRHHELRAAEIFDLLERLPASTSYELSCALFPHIKDFGVMLGISEVVGHLDLIEDDGRLDRTSGFPTCYSAR